MSIGMRNQASWTSSVRYEVARDYVCSVRSHEKGELVLVLAIRGIKLAGLLLSSTKPRERRTCHHLSNTRNQSGGTLSVMYEVTRKESLSSSIQYEEQSRRDFVRPVRSHMKGELVLIHPLRGIKQAGLRPSYTKSRKRRACPRSSSTRIQLCGTSSVRYEAV